MLKRVWSLEDGAYQVSKGFSCEGKHGTERLPKKSCQEKLAVSRKQSSSVLNLVTSSILTMSCVTAQRFVDSIEWEEAGTRWKLGLLFRGISAGWGNGGQSPLVII